MPLWRCPHCGTPQAEASRCWVCHRSTTSCATCRHFRKGVAGGLGICGLDPRHTALRGTEIRACWTAPLALEEADEAALPARTAAAMADSDAPARRPRTFVPVEDLERERRAAAVVPPTPEREAAPSATVAAPLPPPRATPAWSLWGDAEP